MGVVRRDGPWRLEKIEDGHYEISYQRDPELKVFTAEHTANSGQIAFDALPRRDVDSFEEAIGLFEEYANDDTPVNDTTLGGGGVGFEIESTGSQSTNEEDDLPDLPPGGIALVLLGAGAITIYTADFAIGSTVFQFGTIFVLAGVAILGYAGVLYNLDGRDKAIEFLTTIEEGEQDTESPATKKTPPLSEKRKNTLIFDRAGQTCEWCEERFDRLQVHHITPRAENGPNEPSNLIVLCPNHHSMADSGGISRSKLKAKVKRQNRDWDGSF